MTVSAVRRATIETVAIDPRQDGKVEVTFRVTADQKGLTDCAAAFIKAGVSGLEVLDVFSVIFPPEITLGLEPANVSPNIVALDSVRSVRGASAVAGCDFSEMNAPLTASHKDALTAANDPSNLTPLHDVALRLLNLEGMVTTIYHMLRDHDHASRNDMQAISYGMEKLKKVTKPLATLAAASVCGHHLVSSLVDALMSLPGA
jgi:hypothetical protein